MAKMRISDLKALLAAERADALAASTASKLSNERQTATDYYMGDMSSDMPTQDGRSKAVSTDVADTIEGLMPPLMEIFCGGDEVVRFEPVGQEDVKQAEQETDYVNHCFMQKNSGFTVLYGFIKDALLHKVGIVKCYPEEGEREERETYYDQPEDALALLLQKPGAEIVEHTEKEGGLHDVTIVCRTPYKKTIVEGVPPEEFGIARRARNIREANYCFHEVIRFAADLVDEGFDAAQVDKLPTYVDIAGQNEEMARDTVDESTQSDGDAGLNKALRPVLVTEHYVRMDYEGNGKPNLYKVTTGGEQAEVLNRDGKPDIEQVEFAPFAAMTPVIVTHRFFGRSIADLVMDIQRIKTALLRALLDNAYLSNYPRPEVAQSHATDTTLDDLLVWRPGAPIRTKTPGGVTWQEVPSIGQHLYPLLEYQDTTRELRTGVTRVGQGIDADALQNQSATAVQKVYSAAQLRQRLIARIFAETGIKDLFWLLHATLRKGGGQQDTVKLRNQWVTVDPSQWKHRNDLTVSVGLGTGGKAEQLAGIQLLIGMQAQAQAANKTNLVKDSHLYNSAKELVRILGLKSVDQFFDDPNDPENPPPEPAPDPKLIEIQMKAEIEKLQAQADIATNDRKMQLESMIAQQKHELELQQSREEHAMKMQEMRMNLVGKVAGAAVTKTKVSQDGEGGSAVQESGPDMDMLMAIIDKLNPKPSAMRMRKDKDGSWIKEPVS